jgi:hypothetical protein
MGPSVNGDKWWKIDGSPWMRLLIISELNEIRFTNGLVNGKCQVIKIGRLWKFNKQEIDEWVRGGGAENKKH